MTEGTREQGRETGGMNLRAAAWLAWSLAGLSVAIFLASGVLTIMSSYAAPATWPPSTWGTGGLIGGLVIFLPFLAFPLVGALIASKRPQNPIGWICLAVGFLFLLLGVSEYYSIYGVAKPGSVPFPIGLAWLGNWLWMPAVGLFATSLFMLFPDGRLPSRR